ncbi:MAG TPA: DUF3667 domain-containing protein [Longimicrobium sp.]|nr:DUF3667 domain-containing protein [Longimicrobium sp.]
MPAGPSCPNCGSPDLRQYCPDCGQAAPKPTDYSLRAYAAELAGQITNGDGKIIRSLWALVARPGVLTADHLQGRRARYLRPLQLFLLVNVLLFVTAPQVPLFSYSLEKYLRYAPPSPTLATSLVRRATPAGHTHEGPGAAAFQAYERKFNARVDAQRKTLIIFLAPALALVLRMLLAWRRPIDGVPRRYGEHLVFTLHVLALVWLALAGLGMIGTIAGGRLTLNPRALLAVAGAVLLLGIPVYLLRAVRRVYALSWPGSVAVAAVVLTAFTGLLVIYRGLLFFTTYYTL